MPRCPTIAGLLRTLAFKRSCAAAIVECAVVGAALHNAVHSWPINSSAKHQHLSRLGAHHQVLLVDRAFDSAGLVRALEMALNIGALLLQIKILRRCTPVGVLAVESPFARNVCRRLLRRGLLRPYRLIGRFQMTIKSRNSSSISSYRALAGSDGIYQANHRRKPPMRLPERPSNFYCHSLGCTEIGQRPKMRFVQNFRLNGSCCDAA